MRLIKSILIFLPTKKFQLAFPSFIYFSTSNLSRFYLFSTFRYRTSSVPFFINLIIFEVDDFFILLYFSSVDLFLVKQNKYSTVNTTQIEYTHTQEWTRLISMASNRCLLSFHKIKHNSDIMIHSFKEKIHS